MNDNLFAVEAKCGHVGKMFYIPIIFPVFAGSAKEAAHKVMGFSRVKHDHKDAIKAVRKIDAKEFNDLQRKNKNDPYLHCKNKQEQKLIEGLEDRLLEDEVNIAKRKTKRTRDPRRNIKKNKEIVKSSKKHIKECIEDIA